MLFGCAPRVGQLEAHQGRDNPTRHGADTSDLFICVQYLAITSGQSNTASPSMASKRTDGDFRLVMGHTDHICGAMAQFHALPDLKRQRKLDFSSARSR